MGLPRCFSVNSTLSLCLHFLRIKAVALSPVNLRWANKKGGAHEFLLVQASLYRLDIAR